jgi:dihydroorotate dehydrogenase (fumarate)
VYGSYAESIKEINPKKPYIISMAGLSKSDNLTMIKYYNNNVATSWIDAIELNLSCPNVVGKPQIGYDLDATENLLRAIYDDSLEGTSIPIGLKMPPYFDQCQITEMADLINIFPISTVTCINSLGNGLVIDPVRESPVIKPKNGLGGIGGDSILPFALSNVFQFRLSLLDHIDVIGCGGISTGSHAFQHLLVGATMVQVGSAYMREDVNCFQRITQELETIMKSKGYNHVTDFRGKLKDYIE